MAGAQTPLCNGIVQQRWHYRHFDVVFMRKSFRYLCFVAHTRPEPCIHDSSLASPAWIDFLPVLDLRRFSAVL